VSILNNDNKKSSSSLSSQSSKKQKGNDAASVLDLTDTNANGSGSIMQKKVIKDLELANEKRNESANQIQLVVDQNRSLISKLDLLVPKGPQNLGGKIEDMNVVGTGQMSHQKDTNKAFLLRKFKNDLDTLFFEAGLSDKFPHIVYDFSSKDWDCDSLIELFCSCKTISDFTSHIAFSADQCKPSWPIKSKVFRFFLSISN
jgi:hypothetical protein